ncbi:MAG TPA: helix-turn-helix transcriptional regulator [Streptosporangiaceae bacterium]|nr:helix-turn-helix transcriptional regulator [Streptosporangiaceae bacterium]
MGERSSPVYLRWVLGEWLSEIREASGLTGAEVARQLRWAPSKVSRIENHEGVSPGDVRELLDVYGITNPDDVRPLVEMARQAHERGWWQGYGDVLPSWFATFVGMEAGASQERDYRGGLVTGLLQTPDYARAVLADDPRARSVPGELERLIALRLERQQLLHHSADPLRLWAVMDESVLRRAVGSPAVMRRQLAHLAELADAPNITIQVLTEDLVHAALDFPFCLLLFPDRERVPGLVYVENLRRTWYLEDADDLAFYTAVFDGLTRAALDADQSRAALLRQLKAIGE